MVSTVNKRRAQWDEGLPPLPSSDRRPNALSIFNEYADRLLVEWIRRRELPNTRRSESANSWFKREAYRLIRHYLETGNLAKISHNLTVDKRPNRLVDEATKNPFKLGLLAMFSDESISRSDRHVFGNQMLYAWYHDVPAHYLNAFLAISGGPGVIADKLKEQYVEPGFESYVRPERLNYSL